MTGDKNHGTEMREKSITETDIQVMQLLVLAHKHLTNDQGVKENRETRKSKTFTKMLESIF